MALTRMTRTTLWALLGLILAWVLLSVFWAPPHLISTTPYPVDQTPATRSLDYQDIAITSDELVLEGWWIPAPQPIADLIFVHGAGSNRISQYIGSLDFYRTLHDLNISVVTMDIRNHGNSPVTDGTLRMGLAEWPDVVATAQWLDQHHPSDRPRILLGASMGGSTVIHAMRNGLEADAMILLDPLLDVLDSMMEVGEVETGLPPLFFSIAARAAIQRYELPHGETSPLAMAKTLDLPILLIQDWEDPVTRSPFAAELTSNNPRVTLARVPAISVDEACLDGKEAWGTHVAAHPCRPDWTRETVSTFVQSVLSKAPNS
jgi:fermentation-respiration switch protein FrsA (DUF1100 family)